MKKLIVLLVLLISISVCYAKSNELDADNSTKSDSVPLFKKKRVYVKLFYGLSHTFLNSSSERASLLLSSGSGGRFVRYDIKNQKGGSTHSVGGLIDIRIWKGLFLDVGASYETIKSRTKDSTVMDISQYDYSAGWTSYHTNVLKLEQEYRFLSFPLILNYQLPVKHLNFSLGAGASYNLLKGFTTELGEYVYDFPSEYSVKSKYTCYSFILNAGVGIRLDKNFEIDFDGEFKYYYTNDENIQKELHQAGYNPDLNLYTIGVKMGLKF